MNPLNKQPTATFGANKPSTAPTATGGSGGFVFGGASQFGGLSSGSTSLFGGGMAAQPSDDPYAFDIDMSKVKKVEIPKPHEAKTEEEKEAAAADKKNDSNLKGLLK